MRWPQVSRRTGPVGRTEKPQLPPAGLLAQSSPTMEWGARVLLQQGEGHQACPPLFRQVDAQPQRHTHSPANGFFCVSTPQSTMAKLEGNGAG